MLYEIPGCRPIDSNEPLSSFGEVLIRLMHKRGLETLPELGDAAEEKGHLMAWEGLVGLVYGGPGISPRVGYLAAVRDALELTDDEDAELRDALLEYLYAEPERLEEAT